MPTIAKTEVDHIDRALGDRLNVPTRMTLRRLVGGAGVAGVAGQAFLAGRMSYHLGGRTLPPTAHSSLKIRDQKWIR